MRRWALAWGSARSPRPLGCSTEPLLFHLCTQGYVFKVMGGNDKQGFGMKQGVLTNQRVSLLMSPGQQCFRGYGRRKGERRQSSC